MKKLFAITTVLTVLTFTAPLVVLYVAALAIDDTYVA